MGTTVRAVSPGLPGHEHLRQLRAGLLLRVACAVGDAVRDPLFWACWRALQKWPDGSDEFIADRVAGWGYKYVHPNTVRHTRWRRQQRSSGVTRDRE